MSSRAKVAMFAILTLSVARAPQARAQAIVAVEENGRRTYVNNVAVAAETARARPKYYRLVYWSQTEGRYKPVPGAKTMLAARSAASEVRQYLGMSGIAVPSLGVPKLAGQAGETPAAAGCVSGAGCSPGDVASNVSTAAAGPLTSTVVDAAIEQAAERHHVDSNLVRAIVKVESNFNPRAVSRKGAMGLMQLMPGTARDLAVSNPFDPQQNVDAGVRHLKGLLDSYGGDVPLSLAAYNAGAGAVLRNRGVPPYMETRNYVKRITELYGAGGQNTHSGPAPMKVVRGPDGVLTISNTN